MDFKFAIVLPVIDARRFFFVLDGVKVSVAVRADYEMFRWPPNFWVRIKLKC